MSAIHSKLHWLTRVTRVTQVTVNLGRKDIYFLYILLVTLLKIWQFWNIFQFFSAKSPIFNVVECEIVSTGTFFHAGGTSNLGERWKFRKYSKVLIYFVQVCSYRFSGKSSKFGGMCRSREVCNQDINLLNSCQNSSVDIFSP